VLTLALKLLFSTWGQLIDGYD